MENELPIVVFALQEDGNIGRAVRGERIGTLVSGAERDRRDPPRRRGEDGEGGAVAKDDFAGIRTGRATPPMFAKIVVDYYGAMTPVVQLSTLTVPEPRMAVISPYDKSSLGVIERAIRDTDLGVNPTNDGRSSASSFPQLTEERRREFVEGRPGQGGGREGVDPQHPPQSQGGARPPRQGRRDR